MSCPQWDHIQFKNLAREYANKVPEFVAEWLKTRSLEEINAFDAWTHLGCGGLYELCEKMGYTENGGLWK